MIYREKEKKDGSLPKVSMITCIDWHNHAKY